MPSIIDLPYELLLQVTLYLDGGSFMNASESIPGMRSVTSQYESSVVKNIMANTLLLPLSSITHGGPGEKWTVDDIKGLNNSYESTTILQGLFVSTPEFSTSKHDLLDGAAALVEYCRSYREVKRVVEGKSLAPSGLDSGSAGCLATFLQDRFSRETLLAMREVYNILSKRLEDSDNKFNRPRHICRGFYQHGTVQLSLMFQQNLIDTVISSMDFLPGDFEDIEKFGIAELFYEAAVVEDHRGFFSLPFGIALPGDGRCRRVENMQIGEWDRMDRLIRQGLVDSSMRIPTLFDASSYRLSRTCRQKSIRYNSSGYGHDECGVMLQAIDESSGESEFDLAPSFSFLLS